MKIYLAGIESQGKLLEKCKPPNVLFSFASANEQSVKYALSPDCESFLLDSGAFTFMNGKKKVDFDSYCDRYIEFINAYKIPLFFELDLDSVVGLEKTEQFRRRIEARTGRQCIPVWHKSRGKDYFVDMAKNYNYIAIGGIANKSIKKSEHKFFPWFIETAHEHGCKIHGLGYTDFSNVGKYRFDTVDSTSWIVGGKFGNIYTMRDGYPKQTTIRKDGHKCDGEKINEHNMRMFIEYGEKLSRGVIT